MHPNKRVIIPVFLLLVLAAVAAWYWFGISKNETALPLAASGTVEASEIILAPEMPGRVVEVLVEKGDFVKAGDPVLRLDGALLDAQRQRALASLAAAQSSKRAAEVGMESALIALELAKMSVEASFVQMETVVNAARLVERPARITAWEEDIPNEFDQPAWYFTREEIIASAEAELAAAREALASEKAYFEKVIQQSSDAGLVAAEKRLSNARAAFLVAEEVLDRAQDQGDQDLEDFAQGVFDAAEAELEAAQSDYEKILSDAESEELLEARARYIVAQERYETALDHFNILLTGEESLPVRAAHIAQQQTQVSVRQAEIGVRQAETRLDQADKAIAQAQSEVDWVDAQAAKLVVFAASPGVVLSRNVEPGEVIQAGAGVITLGKLDDLKITVFISEDRYGQIQLGQTAEVRVDSFPGKVFTAVVIHIADQAEFTPRNVQTVEGRRTTVFAVELAVDDLDGKLKPGMPVDVNFSNPD